MFTACADLIAARSNNRLLFMHRGGFAVVALWPLFNPISDNADIFTRQHMWELNITLATLDNFVIDNTPVPLPDLMDNDSDESFCDLVDPDLMDNSSDELPELVNLEDSESDDNDSDDEADDGIF